MIDLKINVLATPKACAETQLRRPAPAGFWRDYLSAISEGRPSPLDGASRTALRLQFRQPVHHKPAQMTEAL
jgi:hypothetical protein